MSAAPDSSAVRTALWRALHVQIDDPPHLIDDELGLALADPEDGWRDRPDMHPTGTGPYRAATVARASGTPWISFSTPDEIVALARNAGSARAQRVPTAEIAERYLTGRTDGLRAASGEAILLART